MDALAALQRLGSGRLLDELHEALAATAQEVVATGNPGTVTLTLKISTKEQGNALVVIEEQVKRAPAQRSPHGAIMWALYGQLHREDPRQGRLDFRAVDTETGELREANLEHSVERRIM